jgi:hypothetical protein
MELAGVFVGTKELGGVYSHDFFNFSINYTLRTESIKEYESLKGGRVIWN